MQPYNDLNTLENTAMPYTLQQPENTLEGNESFVNAKGNHECVTLVQHVAAAPHTSTWKQGARVMDAERGKIPLGTVIATFDENGKYPTSSPRHAAIYITHNETEIQVYDQWKSKKKTSKRSIKARGGAKRDQNDADCYYVVE